MKRTIVSLVCVLALASGAMLSGCETTAGSAGAGAALGGLAGGVIGHQSGRALEGAAIGAAAGAISGAIIHDVRERRARTAQETAQDYNYTNDQGFRLDLQGVSVSPATVQRGERVTATSTYATLGTSGESMIQETATLRKDGLPVRTLSSRSISRSDGTWENVIVFQVPRDAETGTYVVEQSLNAQGQNRSAQAVFQVRS